MEYIIYKDFNAKAICGAVNLPRGTICTERNGVIYHGADTLCSKKSENAYKYFARNNDGKGLERGELITSIKTALAIQDEHTYERWYRVWNNPVCQELNSSPNSNSCVWNYGFYSADIDTLDYIYKTITDENWLGIQPPEFEEAEETE